MFRVSVCEDVKHLVHTFSISSECKGRLRRNSGQRTTGPRLTCECILVEVGGRLGVSTGHFVMSIWPKLHHRIVRLRRNLGQRTTGPRLTCECILVEVGGRLGVNTGHFIISIWPKLHHRFVWLRQNLGQRTTGTRLTCEWILVEIGGRLGVNIMGHFVTKISIC